VNFPFYIAKRYLISKKSHNAINIISWISVSGIAIGTLALIIILSAFNGLEELVEDLYASFDPDIKITVNEGKTFHSADFPKDKILALSEVEFYTEALEEIALIKHGDKQTIATIKGVENSFFQMSGLDSLMIEGNVDFSEANNLILGYGIADKLSLFLADERGRKLSIIVPNKGNKKSILPTSEFSRKFATPTGIFSVNPDFDTKYAVTSLPFAQKLLDHSGKVSSIELGLKEGADWDKVKKEIQQIIGDDYRIQTRYEINELIFKTNKTEKWMAFLILSFILVIASFNIIGSLTMLIIDKKKDVWVLKTMGANNSVIRKIFFAEGMLINLLGAFSGMVLGAFICWLQIQFGLLALEGGVVEYYPIKLVFIDFVYVSIIIFIIGLIASWYPVKTLTKKHL
jgi:lipoprotein-releasing system permease protein